jgi:cysteine desulfurase
VNRRIYLDHNATTRVRPEVLDEMAACLGAAGNPSSRHEFGRRAASLRERARERLATALGCDARSVIFTSGGTEADNLALRGCLSGSSKRHLITAATEHEAVLHTARELVGEGVELTVLPVDEFGRVDPDDVSAAIRPNTALVSLMAANNETGAILDLEAVGTRCRERGVPFHTDAVQCFGKQPLELAALPVDLVSVSAHKIGGPQGVGALVVGSGVSLRPSQSGGGQERALRPGTENLPGIVGFGKAAEMAVRDLSANRARWTQLRDDLERGLSEIFPRVRINGPPDARLPNTSHVSFPGIDGESMLIALDLAGVAVSTGAACNAGASEPSHVLLAMGYDHDLASGSIRFSLGWDSAGSDVRGVLDVLPAILERLANARTTS